MTKRIVVTGANRGIGLELVRQLAARGDEVHATARQPEAASELNELAAASKGRVRVHPLEMTREADARALAEALGDLALDGLINNAGVYGGKRQSVEDLDDEGALATFHANALGPLRLTLALRPHLKRGAAAGGGLARMVAVTSGMGSIGDNTSGGYYAYRMSKAALNMAVKSLSVDLRADGITCAVINPGWVRTDMGGPRASVSPAESVQGMLTQIDALTLAETGSFLNWKGGGYVW